MKQIPVVQWAQSSRVIYLRIEVKTKENLGAVQVENLRPKFESRRLLLTYTVEDVDYELDQPLARSVEAAACEYSVNGRNISLSLPKSKVGGWKRPFALTGGKPKWLKTDFNRWDDDVEMVSSEEDDQSASHSKKKADLRSALKEVEAREKAAREEKVKQLEEAIKKGEKPAPREDIGDVDLDSID